MARPLVYASYTLILGCSQLKEGGWRSAKDDDPERRMSGVVAQAWLSKFACERVALDRVDSQKPPMCAIMGVDGFSLLPLPWPWSRP